MYSASPLLKIGLFFAISTKRVTVSVPVSKFTLFRKLDDAGVKIVFEKDTYKMVRGALVLMCGVHIGTLYKLQGSTVIDGSNSSMVHESGVENLVVSEQNTMLWHQRLRHIGEKGLRILHGKGMVEGMNNNSLDFDFC